MMKDRKESFLLDYYKVQVEDICLSMKAITGTYKMKDIHTLRVRIKRLKSVFRLLEFMHPADFKAKDHYRLFKPVFKSAGLIRESQMNRSLLKKYPGTEKLRKSYSRYIARLRLEWDTNLDRSILSFNYSGLDDLYGRIKELLSGITEKELSSYIVSFIKRETGRIKQMYDDEHRLDYLHEIRIIMKNIKPLLGLVWDRKDNNFNKQHLESLNSTETLIGDWHNRLILSESVALFFNARTKNKEKISAQYFNLQKELEKNNKSDHARILESIGEILRLFN
ncbi:MAG: CHAD domain-containing protein [Bacteroidales bacterium]|nr:CHAD domain-containing protein [Bacteroidales bacterium]